MVSEQIKSIGKYLLVIFLQIAFLANILIPGHSMSGVLEVYVLDVGQGDALLIKSPDDYYALIDGGRGSVVLEELSPILPYGRRHIDLVIASHPDADHIEGLLGVLSRYSVGVFLWQKSSKSSSIYSEIARNVQRLTLRNYELREPHSIKLGCCTELDILWPAVDSDIYHLDDVNELSTALTIKYKNFEMFTAGDLGAENEILAIRNYLGDKDIDVLKVGHHGSNTSTSTEFLEIVRPELSLISVGEDNSYGHPTEEILAKLEKAQSLIYRTDFDGAIFVRTDGQRLWVSSEKSLEKFSWEL